MSVARRRSIIGATQPPPLVASVPCVASIDRRRHTPAAAVVAEVADASVDGIVSRSVPVSVLSWWWPADRGHLTGARFRTTTHADADKRMIGQPSLYPSHIRRNCSIHLSIFLHSLMCFIPSIRPTWAISIKGLNYRRSHRSPSINVYANIENYPHYHNTTTHGVNYIPTGNHLRSNPPPPLPPSQSVTLCPVALSSTRVPSSRGDCDKVAACFFIAGRDVGAMSNPL